VVSRKKPSYEYQDLWRTDAVNTLNSERLVYLRNMFNTDRVEHAGVSLPKDAEEDDDWFMFLMKPKTPSSDAAAIK